MVEINQYSQCIFVVLGAILSVTELSVLDAKSTSRPCTLTRSAALSTIALLLQNSVTSSHEKIGHLIPGIKYGSQASNLDSGQGQQLLADVKAWLAAQKPMLL